MRPKSRALAVLLVALFSLSAFSMTSFAFADADTSAAYALPPDGTGPQWTERPVETDAPAAIPTPTPTPTPATVPTAEPGDTSKVLEDLLSAFTPGGNLSLIDDFLFTTTNEEGEKEEKQFITVQSKAGNDYYIVIDRAGDTENVYFLNLVDEADLLALMDDVEEEEPEPAVCTCGDKCYVGHVDTTCPICAVNMKACVGKEPEPEPTPTPEPEPEKKSGVLGTVVVAVLILAVAGGAAYYVLKMRGAKPTPQTEGDTDLNDYDFGTEDEAEKYAEFPQSQEESYSLDPEDDPGL